MSFMREDENVGLGGGERKPFKVSEWIGKQPLLYRGGPTLGEIGSGLGSVLARAVESGDRVLTPLAKGDVENFLYESNFANNVRDDVLREAEKTGRTEQQVLDDRARGNLGLGSMQPMSQDLADRKREYGLNPGVLVNLIEKLDTAWVYGVERPSSTALMVLDSGNPYPLSSRVRDSWNRSEDVSPVQAYAGTSTNIPGDVVSMFVKELPSFKSVDIYQEDPFAPDSIEQANKNNPFYQLYTGSGDFAFDTVMPLGVGTAAKAGKLKLGLGRTTGNYDLATTRADIEADLRGERKTGPGEAVRRIAAETDGNRIADEALVAGAKGVDQATVVDILSKTSDEATVANILLGMRGDQAAVRALNEAAPDHVWALADKNADIQAEYQQIPIGEQPPVVSDLLDPAVRTQEDIMNVRQTFETAAARDSYFNQVKSVVFDDVTGVPIQSASNLPGSRLVEVVRGKAGDIRFKWNTKMFGMDGTPGGWVSTTSAPNVKNGPVITFIAWVGQGARSLGSRVPRGRVDRSALRPNDWREEYNAQFNAVPIFRTSKPVMYDTRVNAAGEIEYEYINPRQLWALHQERIRAAVVQGEEAFEAAWRAWESDALRVIGLNLSNGNQDIAKMFQDNLGAMGADLEIELREQLRRNDGMAIDPATGQAILFEPMTVSMLLDSFNTIDIAEVYRYFAAHGVYDDAAKSSLPVIRYNLRNSLINAFNTLQTMFRSNVLLRIGYIPKNSVGEPWVASLISHGTIIPEEGLSDAVKNFLKNRKQDAQTLTQMLRNRGVEVQDLEKDLVAAMTEYSQLSKQMAILDEELRNLQQGITNPVFSDTELRNLSIAVQARLKTIEDYFRLMMDPDEDIPFEQIIPEMTERQLSEIQGLYSALVGDNPDYLPSLLKRRGEIYAAATARTRTPMKDVDLELEENARTIEELQQAWTGQSENLPEIAAGSWDGTKTIITFKDGSTAVYRGDQEMMFRYFPTDPSPRQRAAGPPPPRTTPGYTLANPAAVVESIKSNVERAIEDAFYAPIQENMQSQLDRLIAYFDQVGPDDYVTVFKVTPSGRRTVEPGDRVHLFEDQARVYADGYVVVPIQVRAKDLYTGKVEYVGPQSAGAVDNWAWHPQYRDRNIKSVEVGGATPEADRLASAAQLRDAKGNRYLIALQAKLAERDELLAKREQLLLESEEVDEYAGMTLNERAELREIENKLLYFEAFRPDDLNKGLPDNNPATVNDTSTLSTVAYPDWTPQQQPRFFEINANVELLDRDLDIAELAVALHKIYVEDVRDTRTLADRPEEHDYSMQDNTRRMWNRQRMSPEDVLGRERLDGPAGRNGKSTSMSQGDLVGAQLAVVYNLIRAGQRDLPDVLLDSVRKAKQLEDFWEDMTPDARRELMDEIEADIAETGGALQDPLYSRLEDLESNELWDWHGFDKDLHLDAQWTDAYGWYGIIEQLERFSDIALLARNLVDALEYSRLAPPPGRARKAEDIFATNQALEYLALLHQKQIIRDVNRAAGNDPEEFISVWRTGDEETNLGVVAVTEQPGGLDAFGGSYGKMDDATPTPGELVEYKVRRDKILFDAKASKGYDRYGDGLADAGKATEEEAELGVSMEDLIPVRGYRLQARVVPQDTLDVDGWEFTAPGPNDFFDVVVIGNVDAVDARKQVRYDDRLGRVQEHTEVPSAGVPALGKQVHSYGGQGTTYFRPASVLADDLYMYASAQAVKTPEELVELLRRYPQVKDMAKNPIQDDLLNWFENLDDHIEDAIDRADVQWGQVESKDATLGEWKDAVFQSFWRIRKETVNRYIPDVRDGYADPNSPWIGVDPTQIKVRRIEVGSAGERAAREGWTPYRGVGKEDGPVEGSDMGAWHRGGRDREYTAIVMFPYDVGMSRGVKVTAEAPEFAEFRAALAEIRQDLQVTVNNDVRASVINREELQELIDRNKELQARLREKIGQRRGKGGKYYGSGQKTTTMMVGNQPVTVQGMLSDVADTGRYRAPTSASETARATYDMTQSRGRPGAGRYRTSDRADVNYGNLAQDADAERLRTFGTTMDTRPLRADDPTTYTQYWKALAYLINAHLRKDPLVKRILQGKSIKELKDWLRTPEGKRHQEAIGRDLLTPNQQSVPARALNSDGTVNIIVSESSGIEDLVRRVFEYIPDREVAKMLADGDMDFSAGEIQAMLGGRTDLTDLPVQRADWGDTNSWQGMVNKLLDPAWQLAQGIPETRLSRWPWFVRESNARFLEKLENLKKQGVEIIDADAFEKTKKAAQREALAELEKTFYNIRRYNQAVYTSRFLTTFPGAAANAFYRYGRFYYREPGRMQVLSNTIANVAQGDLNNANNLFGENILGAAVIGVDEDGNEVDNVSDAVYFAFPWWVSDNNPKGVKFPIDSLATLIVDSPGMSFLVNMSYAAIVNQKPDLDSWIADNIPGGLELQQEYFPFGVTNNIFGQLFGAYQKDLWSGVMGDERFIKTAIYMHMNNLAMWEKGGQNGPRPTQEQAAKDARAWFLGPLAAFFGQNPLNAGLGKSIAKFVSPVSVSNKPPGQMYRDAWYAHREQYPNDTAAARETFVNQYGDWAEWFTYGTSDYTAYVPSTVEAYTAIWKDGSNLVPEILRDLRKDELFDMITVLTFGTQGEYDQAVNNFLKNEPLPGDDESVKNLLTAAEFEAQVEVARGWDTYNKVKIELDANIERLRELRDEAGSQEAKDDYRRQIKEQQVAFRNWWENDGPLADNAPWQASKANRSIRSAGTVTGIILKASKDEKFMEKRKGTQLWDRLVQFAEWEKKQWAKYNTLDSEQKADFRAGVREVYDETYRYYFPEINGIWDRYYQTRWNPADEGAEED